MHGDLCEFRLRSDQNRHFKSKASGNCRFDPPDQRIRRGAFALEQDIAALDVRADGLKMKPFEQVFQLAHFDHFLAADVDAAQDGEVGSQDKIRI